MYSSFSSLFNLLKLILREKNKKGKYFFRTYLKIISSFPTAVSTFFFHKKYLYSLSVRIVTSLSADFPKRWIIAFKSRRSGVRSPFSYLQYVPCEQRPQHNFFCPTSFSKRRSYNNSLIFLSFILISFVKLSA